MAVEGDLNKANGDIFYAGDVTELLNSMGRFASFDANRILKADTSVFVNGQYSAADDFTDATGVMNTVTSTDATWNDVDLSFGLGFTDEASGDTTHDPDGAISPELAFDGDDGTSAYTGAASGSLGKIFSAKYIADFKFKAMSAAGDYGASASGTMYIYIETYNGSTWDLVETYSGTYSYGGGGGSGSFTKATTLSINDTIEGIRIRLSCTGNGGGRANSRWYTEEYGGYDSSSDIIVDPEFIVTTPKSIVVYGEKTEPANTDITIEVSDDGGSTWGVTGGTFDNVIDTTSLSGTDIAIKFKLSASTAGVTPLIYGYGAVITNA